MPTKKPKGSELAPEQKDANRALAQRRVAIEHVNCSIKRCRILKDVSRFLRSGVRDQVMEICCALHKFRLRLDPWLPIPSIGIKSNGFPCDKAYANTHKLTAELTADTIDLGSYHIGHIWTKISSYTLKKRRK